VGLDPTEHRHVSQKEVQDHVEADDFHVDWYKYYDGYRANVMTRG